MTKALIVVDMQNDFVDGSLGTPEAAAIVQKVIEKVIGFDGIILHTLDTHHKDYLSTQEGRKLPVEHCIYGTPGWELNESVGVALERRKSTGFCKNTFGCIGLIEYIEEHRGGVPFDSVTFIGLCTDICVISNALLYKAYYPQSEIIVDASCCAGVTPETHKAALDVMKMCQIEVTGE